METENVVIIGSGPAGLTAAIYAARAELRPTVVTGMQPGGQITQTTMVDNYPGFPEGVMGPDLMDNMRKQAERFGTRFVEEEVKEVNLKNKPFTIKTETKEFKAKTVIVATGAVARWLNVPGEGKLKGRGVSGCATCDGFFFKGKDVVVIGGGDTALEDASFLTRFANSVTIIHRRNELRASKIMQEHAMSNPKIKFIWDTVVTEVLGDDRVTGVVLSNVKTNQKREHKCDGVFVAIGHSPATGVFRGQVELDEEGYVKRKNGTKTNIEGDFVAGDVADRTYRQVIVAAGEGCKASMDAEKYLQEKR